MKTHSPCFMVAVISLTFLTPAHTDVAQAQSSITEEEVYTTGVDAYLYFYPLVTMDITREQLTNVELGKGLGGPMNTFVNIPQYPTSIPDGAATVTVNGANYREFGGVWYRALYSGSDVVYQTVANRIGGDPVFETARNSTVYLLGISPRPNSITPIVSGNLRAEDLGKVKPLFR